MLSASAPEAKPHNAPSAVLPSAASVPPISVKPIDPGVWSWNNAECWAAGMQHLLSAHGLWAAAQSGAADAHTSALAALLIKAHLPRRDELARSTISDAAALWALVRDRTARPSYEHSLRCRDAFKAYHVGMARSAGRYLEGKHARLDALIKAGGSISAAEIFESYIDGIAAVDPQVAGCLRMMAGGDLQRLKSYIRNHTGLSPKHACAAGSLKEEYSDHD